MIFSLLLLFLSFFIITSFPIISFAQQSDIHVPTIAQIPSVEEQSQLGFLIITTNVINDNGGTKQESDFTINMLGSQSFPSSFQASPFPQVQIISIQEGQYSISVDNAQGYKISFGNQCEGQIKAGDKKSCSITLDDSSTKKTPSEQLPLFPLSLPSLPSPSQTSGEDRLTISQIPSVEEEQSQLGFLILATYVINDNGGTKQAPNFKINMLGSQSFPSSFQAASSNLMQIISIQEGQYSISVDNAQGYKISFGNQCEGQIKDGEIKTCLLTLDDLSTTTPPPVQDPVANLVAPSQVQAGQTVVLDASQSVADTLTITQTAGQPVTLTDIGAFKKQFTAPNGNFQLGFQAIAQKGSKQATTQVSIQVSTTPPPVQDPVANLVAPSQVQAGQTVVLDASQSVADTLTITQTAGQPVTLTDIGAFKKQFTPPTGNFQLGFKAIPQKGIKQAKTQVPIKVSTTLPPPTGGVFPVPNVLWFYDSQPSLTKDMVLKGGQTHPTDRVILSSSASGVSSHPIKNGWLEVQSGGGNGRVYWNYHEVPQFSQLPTAGFNTAMTGTFMFKPGIDNLSIKDGNHGTNGWILDGKVVFGGFGLSFHRTDVQSKAEYWHNNQGSSTTVSYPNGLQLVDNKEYKFFLTLVTDRVKQEVVLNAWLDFGDGKGWIQVMKDRKWGQSGWSPGSVPNGNDKADILKGPSFIKKHHIWTRANGDSFLPVKDIKIGTLPFLS